MSLEPPDEVILEGCVGADIVATFSGSAALDGSVRVARSGVRPQEVTQRKVAINIVRTCTKRMYLMRPLRGSLDEVTPPRNSVLSSRLVPKAAKGCSPGVEQLNLRHLEKDVDDRLGGQPGNGSTADVVDSGVWAKNVLQRFPLVLEHGCPHRAERLDLYGSLAQWRTPSRFPCAAAAEQAIATARTWPDSSSRSLIAMLTMNSRIPAGMASGSTHGLMRAVCPSACRFEARRASTLACPRAAARDRQLLADMRPQRPQRGRLKAVARRRPSRRCGSAAASTCLRLPKHPCGARSTNASAGQASSAIKPS
jgi:hypothetical protein